MQTSSRVDQGEASWPLSPTSEEGWKPWEFLGIDYNKHFVITILLIIIIIMQEQGSSVRLVMV